MLVSSLELLKRKLNDNNISFNDLYTIVTSIIEVSEVISDGGGSGTVDSVNGQTGEVVLSKSDIGLGDVENTTDANKPISSATQTALDGKQPLDSDLTAIAALSPANDTIIQRKSGAWTGRTMSQLKTDLVLVASDVGLGNVNNTSDTNKPISTATQTALNAKADRVPAVQNVTSSATVTATTTNDLVVISAQAVTLTLANPSGTWQQGQALLYRIKDNGSARTINFGNNFRAIGIELPTTTTENKVMYIGCIYDSTDTKWDVLSIAIEE